ncbi:MAG TPA: YcgN family cysteine cluster protein [Propylenella sp.]|nr:YcgN family cysteine cluster protein [Propylenella sp.]
MDQEPADEPFWRTKRLDEMSPAEWESLCDGCARCCLNKLEDVDTGEIAWTDVACHLLDGSTCRCRDYANRQQHVPDCIPLDPNAVRNLGWLPPTCAYRLVEEGRDLYWWHPLVSGDPDSVHQAGISVRGRTVSEELWPVERFPDRIVKWPGSRPRARRKPPTA